MFRSKFANQLTAAAFSVILSASLLAYAIVPASPGLA
ncbi:MAG: enoyl-CoA hydratase [Erythrobacter sp.]